MRCAASAARSKPLRGGTGERGSARCVVRRKCATCGDRTEHAYLRDDEHSDCFEEGQQEYEARQRVLKLIGSLQSCGVMVVWRPDDWHELRPGEVAVFVQFLDEAYGDDHTHDSHLAW